MDWARRGSLLSIAATVWSFANLLLGLSNRNKVVLWPQDVKVVLGEPSQKERAIGAVHYKKEGMLLQPLSWCCFGSAIHHERDVRKSNTQIYVTQTSSNRVISSGGLC